MNIVVPDWLEFLVFKVSLARAVYYQVIYLLPKIYYEKYGRKQHPASKHDAVATALHQ